MCFGGILENRVRHPLFGRFVKNPFFRVSERCLKPLTDKKLVHGSRGTAEFLADVGRGQMKFRIIGDIIIRFSLIHRCF